MGFIKQQAMVGTYPNLMDDDTREITTSEYDTSATASNMEVSFNGKTEEVDNWRAPPIKAEARLEDIYYWLDDRDFYDTYDVGLDKDVCTIRPGGRRCSSPAPSESISTVDLKLAPCKVHKDSTQCLLESVHIKEEIEEKQPRHVQSATRLVLQFIEWGFVDPLFEIFHVQQAHPIECSVADHLKRELEQKQQDLHNMTELVEDIRVSSLVSGPVDLVKDCGLIYADIVSTVVEWTVWKPITTCFLPLAILYQMETQASQTSVETVDPLVINTESSSSIAVPEQSKGKSHGVLAETVGLPTREESVDTLYSDEDLVSESHSVGNDGLSREGSNNVNEREIIPAPSHAIDSKPIPLPLKVIEKACGIAVNTAAAVIQATVIKPVSIITTPYYFLKRCII
ncbi:hypothetical protein HDV02_005184 [Globomyces sp. JEL0801]|nr:hypothetical protein HDV02_005184 [Globomyces sp. JEL0801]